MKIRRQGAFLLLAVVVLWTALPASACLLARHAMAQPACCRAMKDCDSPMMGAENACCQVHEGSAAVVTILPFSNDDHAQYSFVMFHLSSMEPSAAQWCGFAHMHVTPPPKFPPGGAFALRI